MKCNSPLNVLPSVELAEWKAQFQGEKDVIEEISPSPFGLSPMSEELWENTKGNHAINQALPEDMDSMVDKEVGVASDVAMNDDALNKDALGNEAAKVSDALGNGDALNGAAKEDDGSKHDDASNDVVPSIGDEAL